MTSHQDKLKLALDALHVAQPYVNINGTDIETVKVGETIDKLEAALQSLADQAQELGMGYGELMKAQIYKSKAELGIDVNDAATVAQESHSSVEQLSELLRGLECGAHFGSAKPIILFKLGKAIASQAKLAQQSQEIVPDAFMELYNQVKRANDEGENDFKDPLFEAEIAAIDLFLNGDLITHSAASKDAVQEPVAYYRDVRKYNEWENSSKVDHEGYMSREWHTHAKFGENPRKPTGEGWVAVYDSTPPQPIDRQAERIAELEIELKVERERADSYGSAAFKYYKLYIEQSPSTNAQPKNDNFRENSSLYWAWQGWQAALARKE